jgi:hypothetical protein
MHRGGEVCLLLSAVNYFSMNLSQRRPLVREGCSSSVLSDEMSCASSQSSVQRRVADLRSHRGNFRGFLETRPTSTTFPKKLNLLKKKKLFRIWKDLWVARSFSRFSLMRRSFDYWSRCCGRDESVKWKQNHSDAFTETDYSDVSDLSSVSTSHTTISKPDLHHFLGHQHASRRRGKAHFPAMREISDTIQELSLIYRDRGLREDDETMTSLSTLNTRDYIHLASSRPSHRRASTQAGQIDEESEEESVQFSTPVVPSSLFERSPDSSQSWKSSPGIGALLVQHGDILPTQSLPLGFPDGKRLANSQPVTLPSVAYDRVSSRSLSGSPVGHRRSHSSRLFGAGGARTPPPPPPPPLLSHNLKHFSSRPVGSSSSFSSTSASGDQPSRRVLSSKCRSLLRHWVLFHRRTVGIRLIATDHFLRRGFVLFSKSLRKRARRKRRLIACEEFRKKAMVSHGIRRLLDISKSAVHRSAPLAAIDTNPCQLSRSFKRFVSQIEFLKTRRPLLKRSSELAVRSSADHSLFAVIFLWKGYLLSRRFLRASHRKVLSLLRPHLLAWAAASRLHRKLRSQSLPLRHTLLSRALLRWRSHFQLVLCHLQSFTEIDIRRETSLLSLSLQLLSRSSRSRRRLSRLGGTADRHHRAHILTCAFSLLRRRPPLRKAKANRSQRIAPRPRLQTSLLSRPLKNWASWCGGRFERLRAEQIGHRFFVTRLKRQFLVRLSSVLYRSSGFHRRDTRIGADPKRSSHNSRSFTRDPPRGAQHPRSSSSSSQQTIPPFLLIQRADDWHRRRLLSSCHEFLRKLWRMAFFSSYPSAQTHRLSLRSDRATAEQELYSKEIFLREKHRRVVVLDAFIVWLTSFRGFRCRRLRLLRVGLLTFLQLCTRRTVANHLLELGDRYYDLRQKRWVVRTWVESLTQRQFRREIMGERDARAWTPSAPPPFLDEYLEDSSAPPPPSRPPVHPPRSPYELSREFGRERSSTRRRRWEGL